MFAVSVDETWLYLDQNSIRQLSEFIASYVQVDTSVIVYGFVILLYIGLLRILGRPLSKNSSSAFHLLLFFSFELPVV